MDAVFAYLERVDGRALPAARRAFACFEPYAYDAEDYARAMRWAPESCQNEVVDLLRSLRDQAEVFEQDGDEARFNAEQNALVITHAEEYYRTMIGGAAPSWNIRDRHMMETLDRLLDHHGPQAKAIVWAHNTHIGDARFTDMAGDGMVNIGQLAREERGRSDVVLVGFSTYRGTVIAAEDWGAPRQVMPVPPGRPGSWESQLHAAAADDALLVFDRHGALAELLEPRGHRAIGVVYRPDYEAYGNYVPTVLPRRYDALAYFDVTRAILPLGAPGTFEHEAPETYPSGA
jgi:erythromycin esterase-like protein